MKRAFWVWAVLTGCAAEKHDGDSEIAGDDEGSAGESTTTDEGSTTVPSGDGSSDEGASVDLEAFAQMCAAQASQGDCEAVESAHDAWQDVTAWCSWGTWVPVVLADDGACELGSPQAVCVIATASEAGCDGEPIACGSTYVPARTATDGGIELGTFNPCTQEGDLLCRFDGDEVLEGPPECACICDAAFPSS